MRRFIEDLRSKREEPYNQAIALVRLFFIPLGSLLVSCSISQNQQLQSHKEQIRTEVSTQADMQKHVSFEAEEDIFKEFIFEVENTPKIGIESEAINPKRRLIIRERQKTRSKHQNQKRQKQSHVQAHLKLRQAKNLQSQRSIQQNSLIKPFILELCTIRFLNFWQI